MRVVLLSLIVLTGVSARELLFLGLGEKCSNGTAEPWTCKASSTCKGLKNGFGKDGEMKLCGFNGREAIICCPPEVSELELDDKIAPLSVQPEGGKKAEEKCREYAEYVYLWVEPIILIPGAKKKKIDECAINAETLIVGGTPAKSKEFPHMALLGVERKGNNPLWFCGGSLISPNFVLTAAHCNVSRIKDSVVARLGELNLLEIKHHDPPIDVKIVQVIDHPMYVPSKSYHDISLLKLAKEVELGPNIRPLCLQTNRNIGREKAVASGWGYTNASFGNVGVPSSSLLKVLLNITSDDTCVNAYGTYWPKVSQGIKSDFMFCSGGVRGKDTCQGDSGGPLQIALKDPYCMYSLIGITSFGIGCGSTTPGVYTRVSAYVPWIEKIVWP